PRGLGRCLSGGFSVVFAVGLSERLLAALGALPCNFRLGATLCSVWQKLRTTSCKKFSVNRFTCFPGSRGCAREILRMIQSLALSSTTILPAPPPRASRSDHQPNR